ncbi:MAG TPA: hypothetical protein ENL10_01805 [Candidatus Cloacimonetes bacterium]|nr:hypothetical protein [Candidatus Cloacimonadota bacterium]
MLEVDLGPVEVESIVKEHNCEIIESGFDVSGPFLIIYDPAGLRLRIGSALGGTNKRKKRASILFSFRKEVI